MMIRIRIVSENLILMTMNEGIIISAERIMTVWMKKLTVFVEKMTVSVKKVTVFVKIIPGL